jgi:tRNA-2-methylthio-N6-dimethylallyladenosine synthase
VTICEKAMTKTMTKKLYIKTYGCQMNVYDSDRMADILSTFGYQLTDNPEEADLSILNTCHIREKAEQKVYSDLGRLRDHRTERLKNFNKEMIIAVGGCVAQAEGAEIIRQAPYVDLVFGPQTYHRLPELVARATRAKALKSTDSGGRGIVDIDFPLESKFDELPQTNRSQFSAFLTIQEGCDKFCTYCVVPYTRGAEFSRPAEKILQEAKHLVTLGAKEITLLGQNVNAYHGDAAVISSIPSQKEWGLAQLIEALATLPGLERIRYMTSHPSDMNQDLIRAHRDIPQLMPFLHLPVQSGSNRILEAMNRKHTRGSYLEILSQLREARPDMALSSDFIVGFPGESDQDFEETVDLVKQVRYAQAYSFKYSIRPGTPAGFMELQIPEDVKTERLKILQDVLNEHQQGFNEQTVGKIVPILLDRKGRQEGQLIGRSPYMQSVIVQGNDRLIGQIVDVEIKSGHANSMMGAIVTHERVTFA